MNNTMNNTIRALWQGELPFGEELMPPDTPERRAISKRMDKLRKQIINALSQEDRAVLDEYESEFSAYQAFDLEQTFVVGFRLGMRLTAEAFL
ncbi:MAG: hypothetical protein IJD10_07685, partial [Clostridia bacterium]|nr:hypothetical protein [Clostridia bacterium]